ncbi:hypothetical protein Hanom_Chr09g00830021 [Helianthus anomalus]
MDLTSQMKMAKFQTFWIQMRKSKPLDEIHKTGQTSGTKMAFYSTGSQLITLKSSISAKSGKKGKISSIFNRPSVSLRKAIAFLMLSRLVPFSCSTTCLATISHNFFLRSSSSSTLSASAIASSGSTLITKVKHENVKRA